MFGKRFHLMNVDYIIEAFKVLENREQNAQNYVNAANYMEARCQLYNLRKLMGAKVELLEQKDL